MTDRELIIKLRNENNILKAQNLKNSSKVIKVNQIKTVMPADYENIKKMLNTAQKRCIKYQKIIEMGNISSLDMLIEEYINFSKTKLKKIANEIKLNEYSLENNKEVEYFISYLDFIRNELSNFTDLAELGRLHKPLLTKCKKQLRNVMNLLITTTDIDENELIELYDFAKTFEMHLKKKVESHE